MRFKTLSLYADFMNFLRKEAARPKKHVRIGDLLLTFKLINTAHLAAESKLTYAYLLVHRHDITGSRVPVLSEKLGMTTRQIRNSLKELESTNHIKLITTQQAADLSGLIYYYEIVDPTMYGMLDLEQEQPEVKETMALSAISE